MSEVITKTPKEEVLQNPRASLIDLVDNPKASLADILAEAGIEKMSPEDRLALIKHATVDDYIKIVDVIHRKVAPEHSHEAHRTPVKFVDANGNINGYAARPEERRSIMEYALESAKRITQKYHEEGGLIEDALQRCGNLAAFGIVLAHTYENGNGRSARPLAGIIRNGFDSNDPESVSDLATLSANRPEKGFRINSYVPTGEWSDGRANQNPIAFLDVVAALDVPLDGTSYNSVPKGAFTTPYN